MVDHYGVNSVGTTGLERFELFMSFFDSARSDEGYSLKSLFSGAEDFWAFGFDVVVRNGVGEMPVEKSINSFLNG